MVIGLLGILKAGGAYVPIGPELFQRAARVHARGHATPVIVTQERFANCLRELPIKESVLDSAWDDLSSAEPQENP